MIRRISKNNDYKDIITSYPVEVIDSIYKIEYYIGGHADESYEATFTKNVNVLVAIIPSSALKEMPNGMLYRKAYYKVSDSSYTDGYYDLEMVDNMEVWVGDDETSVSAGGASLDGYATKTWVEGQEYMKSSSFNSFNMLVNSRKEVKCRVSFTPESTNDNLNFASLGTVRNFYNASLKTSDFWSGTQAEWDDLTDEEKESYKIAMIVNG